MIELILFNIFFFFFCSVTAVAVEKVSSGRQLLDLTGKSSKTYFVIGQRGSGKSVLIEWAAEKFHKKKFLVLDMFDAGDYESCYWAIPNCDTPHPKYPKDKSKNCNTPLGFRKHCVKCNSVLWGNYCKKCKIHFESNEWNWEVLKVCPKCKAPVSEVKTDYSILFVHPSNAQVSSVNPKIIPVSAEKGLEVIVRKALSGGHIISIACGLFDADELYLTLANWMFEWIDMKRDKIRRKAVIVIREAANVAFSQTKISEFQGDLKKAMINLIRFARHYQTTIFFDTQRFKDLNIGIRDIVETIIIKRHAFHGMPDVVDVVHKSLEWQRFKMKEKGAELWELKKHLTLPTELFPSQFIARFHDGYFVKNQNGMPKFHHRDPDDFFLDYAGLNVVKEPHKFLARDAQTVRQVPKHILKNLAHTMVERDGISEDLVAEWLNFAPTTIRTWVNHVEAELADD